MLKKGELISSKNGRHTLEMQQDGNLVLYRRNKPIWASNTTSSGHYLMFSGANLAVYDQNDTVLWYKVGDDASPSSNQFMVQNDGNLVLANYIDIFWSTGTSQCIISVLC